MKSLVNKQRQTQGQGQDAQKLGKMVQEMMEIEGVKNLLEAERLYRIPGKAAEALTTVYESIKLLKEENEQQEKLQVALALAAELELESKTKRCTQRAMELLDEADQITSGTARVESLRARVLKAQGKLKAAIAILEPFGDGPRPMCTLNGMDFFHLGRAWGDMGADEAYAKKAVKLLTAGWARGAGADASYALGQMHEQTYVEEALTMFNWGPVHEKKGSYEESLEFYKKAARENRRDARPPYRLGLLAEDGYLQKIYFGLGSIPPTPEGGENSVEDELSRITNAKTWSASSMEEEILAIARKHGVVEDSPEVSVLLQALTAEHKQLTEANDRDKCETVMVLYHYKARQLISEGGCPVGRANKVDLFLREAWQFYQEALAVDKNCGIDVHLHLARTQRWMGMGDKAVLTLSAALEQHPDNAQLVTYLALVRKPPEEGTPCPPAVWEARKSLLQCVKDAEAMGSKLPVACLSKELMHVSSPDLLRMVCAVTAEYNKNEDYPAAREIAHPLIALVPEVIQMLGDTGVAPLELKEDLKNLQAHYLKALLNEGSKECMDEAIIIFDQLYEIFKVCCNVPGVAVSKLERFVQVCQEAAASMKLRTDAHARLGSAILIRITNDPSYDKSSQKANRVKELKKAEKELRDALELEGQPCETELQPAAAAPPPPEPVESKTSIVEEDEDLEEDKISPKPVKSPGKKSQVALPAAVASPTPEAAAPTPAKKDQRKSLAMKRMSAFGPAILEGLVQKESKQQVDTINPKSYLARMELQKVLREIEFNSPGMLAPKDKLSESARLECIQLLKECIAMDPKNVEPYVMLGEVMMPYSGKEALEEMSKYPTPDDRPLTFDDSFLHTEIVRLAFKHAESEGRESAMYYSPIVERSLVTAGKVLGFDGISKWTDILDKKAKYKLCKKVYCLVIGRSETDPDIQQFLKSKGWDV